MIDAPDIITAQTKRADYLGAADRLAACLLWGVECAWSEWRHASLVAQEGNQSADTPAVAKAMKKLLRELEQRGKPEDRVKADLLRSWLKHEERPRRGPPKLSERSDYSSRFASWLVSLLFALRNLGVEPTFNKHERQKSGPSDFADLMAQMVFERKVDVGALLTAMRPMMPPEAVATINFDDIEAVRAFAQRAAGSKRLILRELTSFIDRRRTEARRIPLTMASWLRINGTVDEILRRNRQSLPALPPQ
jgi:hypothetical protein